MNINKYKNEMIFFLAVGLGAYGGFPPAPQWWLDLSKHEWFQYLCMWLLVYVGGGKGELIWTTVVTTIVYVIMKYSDRYIKFKNDTNLYLEDKYKTRFYN